MQGLQEANKYVELLVYISYALQDVQRKAFLLPFLTCTSPNRCTIEEVGPLDE